MTNEAYPRSFFTRIFNND